MKFILHNLRMIWSRFRSNGWVLAELFLVFVVMWFLCDSLGCLKYTFTVLLVTTLTTYIDLQRL